MKEVLIAGVGGQGSVLAAKILAQAASVQGWQVRTAETIGMAQRGGTVVSHVRMGDQGETVYAPLIGNGCADVIIALEPGEGLRALPYLAEDGVMVCATTPVASVMTNLAGGSYDGSAHISYLQQQVKHFVAVDDAALCAEVGSRKALNIVMLASAVQFCIGTVAAGQGAGLADAITIDQLRDALRACVKPRFVDMNCRAVDVAVAALQE